MAATIRTTQYRIKDDASGFSGTTMTLTLRQDLATHYFVMIQTEGIWDGAANSAPNACMIGVSKDPFGTGDLGTTTGADELEFERGSSTENWQGVITVVECLGDHDASGFRLRHVMSHAMAASDVSDSVSIPSGSEWADIGQVGVYAGEGGGGVGTASSGSTTFPVVFARVWPANGTPDTLEFRRDLTGGGSAAAEFVAYVVEWGSEWTIQRVNVNGTNGGAGVDATGEYNTATITSVTRANTFVTANGTTSDNGLGDSWAGAVFTLGDGVTQNSTETKVAVGLHYSGETIDAEVYVHEHADLAVDYRFGTSGGTGINSFNTSSTMPCDAKAGTETYGSVGSWQDYTEGVRAVIWSNSQAASGNAYPRSLVSGRHTASTTITWNRVRGGTDGAIWLQSVDFDGVTYVDAITVYPDSAAVTLGASDAAVAKALTVYPDSAGIAMGASDASVAKALTVHPTSAPIILGAAAPTATRAKVIEADSASITLGASQATVAKGLIVYPTSASISLGANDATASKALTVTPDAAEITLGAADPSVAKALVVYPTSAAIVLSAHDPSAARSLTIEADSAAITLGADAASVAKALTVYPTSASITLGASDPSVARAKLIQANAATITLGSSPATVGRAKTIEADSAPISLSAFDASVQRVKIVYPTSAPIVIGAPSVNAVYIGQIVYAMPAFITLTAGSIVGGARDLVEADLEIKRTAFFRLKTLKTLGFRLRIDRKIDRPLDIIRTASASGKTTTALDFELER